MTKQVAVSFEKCSKNAGLQGSTLSSHCMTTGFSPFELPTYEHFAHIGLFPALARSSLAVRNSVRISRPGNEARAYSPGIRMRV